MRLSGAYLVTFDKNQDLNAESIIRLALKLPSIPVMGSYSKLTPNPFTTIG